MSLGGHLWNASRACKCSLGLRRHRSLAKRLMHMVHFSGNTSVVLKSSLDWLNYTGFPGDVCVAFINVLPGNKDAVAPNPLTRGESRRVYKCDGECLSGSTKLKMCEIFQVCGISSLKYVREFHWESVIVVTFPHPETWRWIKQTVIGCLTCQTAS